MRRPLTLQRRLALAFTGWFATALLFYGAAVAAALVAIERSEQPEPGPAAAQEDEDAEVVRSVWIAMLVAGVPTLIGAAFIGSRLSRSALSPMREATLRAVQARASAFHLALPLRNTGDEWDQLAQALNEILVEGRQAMSRTVRFTADAAHELRTPLTIIRGEAELALRKLRAPEEYREALQTIAEESARLGALVDALLLLARGDERALVARGTPVSLDAVIGLTVERLRDEAAQHGKLLTYDCPSGLPGVSGSAALLSQAVENLVVNAILHGGTHVSVGCRSTPSAVEVWVHDDGPGVPPELVPRLFERFARGDPARSSPGFGLGLSLAQAIASAHGGSVRYEAGQPDGCQFTLSVPSEQGAYGTPRAPIHL
jgi:two-component system, OmpR family, heavy metal sensor histidine kinase CusS